MISTRRLAEATTLALLAGAAVALGPTGPAAAAPTIVTFDTVGAHDWTPPAGVTKATFDVYGAQGGGVPGITSGGRGARATVTMALIPGVDYQVNVGGQGSDGLPSRGSAPGGFNGGGAGGASDQVGGGSGGGASDVRYGDDSVDNRIVVAGGGGGTAAQIAETSPGQLGVISGGIGGAGGATGAAGTAAGGGGGGTQSAGGSKGAVDGSSNNFAGNSFGGGRGADTSNSDSCCAGAGGGGGYYGGGGGGVTVSPYANYVIGGGGGGGSSHGPSGTVFKTGVRSGNGKVVISYLVGTYQPDLAVKRSSDASYVGSNIYSATASGELRSWTAAVGSTRTFNVRVQNDGNTADTLTVKGTGSTAKFTVTYLFGTTNVTTAMVAGTLKLSKLAPGASRVYSVRIKATSQARRGDVRTVTVKAVSSTDPTSADAVQAKLTVS